MLSMNAALDKIKGRFADSVPDELIHHLCHALGYRWRDRALGPLVTTHLFLQQVLHGNIAVAQLRRLCPLPFTEAAYCQARVRLPRTLLERLQASLTTRLLHTMKVRTTELWHGHRVFLLDGSGFSMADTPALQARFGQPGGQAKGCGFPVAHLMTRFDAATGLLLQTAALPMRSHDLSGVAAMHQDVGSGDVLVGDRAFGSYAHLALCQKRGIHGVFRAHQKQIIDFRPHRRQASVRSRQAGESGLPSSRWLKRLGRHDQLVEYVQPKKRPSWLSVEEYGQLPERLVVREVRYRIQERKRRTRMVTLVTTLLDPKRYPVQELAKLYGLRWTVETNLRHLKQTLHMDILRCQTVEGVLKELTVFIIIYNLVRAVMWEASRRQAVPVARISFIDAWRWLRCAQPEAALAVLVVNPERPGRAEPRVRKRRPKEFSLMKRPRAVLRKELRTKRVAA